MSFIDQYYQISVLIYKCKTTKRFYKTGLNKFHRSVNIYIHCNFFIGVCFFSDDEEDTVELRLVDCFRRGIFGDTSVSTLDFFRGLSSSKFRFLEGVCSVVSVESFLFCGGCKRNILNDEILCH